MKPTVYLGVFVDEFLELDQGPSHRWLHVWFTLFHALDKMLRALDSKETSN